MSKGIREEKELGTSLRMGGNAELGLGEGLSKAVMASLYLLMNMSAV
jgi:hypothetical protein